MTPLMEPSWATQKHPTWIYFGINPEKCRHQSAHISPKNVSYHGHFPIDFLWSKLTSHEPAIWATEEPWEGARRVAMEDHPGGINGKLQTLASGKHTKKCGKSPFLNRTIHYKWHCVNRFVELSGGCWLVVWNLWMVFPSICNKTWIIPSDDVIFSEGYIPPNSKNVNWQWRVIVSDCRLTYNVRPPSDNFAYNPI